MNKKLGRLFWPGLWVYFSAMALFTVIAALTQHYMVALAEFSVSVFVLIFYALNRSRRRSAVQSYAKSVFDVPQPAGNADLPFPMAMIRMGDSTVVWTNDAFCNITGYQDRYLEQKLSSVLPNFQTDWLTSGKSEYPYDVSLGGRRYRVYGTLIRLDDADQTVMGMLYFGDLTELYQIRDEYVRSRPVVSIILVDNYEELTKNLTEGAISSLNAKLNDAISKWTEGYHGLLRKMERNRFLFVFEKRDLNQAMEDKFSLLDEVHQIENPTGLSASVSIGIGVDVFKALLINLQSSRRAREHSPFLRVEFSKMSDIGTCSNLYACRTTNILVVPCMFLCCHSFYFVLCVEFFVRKV